MSTLGGWCMAAPGARVPHVGCTFALFAADCMRRAYTAAANLLRDYAYEIEDAD
jgi:hypothetical protein